MQRDGTLLLLHLLLPIASSLSPKFVAPLSQQPPPPPLPRLLPQQHLPTLLVSESGTVARGLGYLVGAGSLLLYSPIAIRVVRQQDASGLTLSTWWLKLLSYACSDVYSFSKGFPASTYIETLVVTVEAAIVLALVAFYQRRVDAPFAALSLAYVVGLAWALLAAPAEAIALGQAAATLLNTGALLPQILLNFQQRSPGGYSPLTAGLACAGCSIRLFTTVELAGSDALLLAGFGFGLALNGALLAQILYYGSVVEGRPLLEVLTADFSASAESVEKRSDALQVAARRKPSDDETTAILRSEEEAQPMRPWPSDDDERGGDGARRRKD